MILITGAAHNLGRKMALSLAGKAPLLLHYHQSSQEALSLQQEIKERGGESVLVQGDFVSDLPSLMKTFQKYPVETIIHNVGNYLTTSLLQTETAIFQELFQINVFAPLAITKSLIEGIKKKKGSILHLGMCGLQLRGYERLAVYNLTKLNLLSMTKSLAKELIPFEVRVNMVSPGYLETSIDLPLEKEKEIPLSAVVRAVLFLLNPENRHITGQNIEVAGGGGL